MIKGRQQQYEGVLDIPEGKSGEFEIRHIIEPPKCFQLSNVRTRMIGGDAYGEVCYDKPTRWHELLQDGGRWMSDIPMEQAQHDAALKPFRSGSVLVGGLGLGYAVTVLAQRPKISRVTVVEKAKEVIELVWPHLLKREKRARAKVEVVHADLFDFLEDLRPKVGAVERVYTHAFYDIWQSDGEGTFFEVVIPLLKLSDRVVVQRPVCWNENVMRGQLYMGLESRARMCLARDQGISAEVLDAWPTLETLATPNEKAGIWHNWSVPFYQWMQKAKPDEAKLTRAIQQYVSSYGVPVWEGLWDLGL